VDVVYVCRPGPNEELRYSLRSLANLDHDEVWVFGGCPDWVKAQTVEVRRDRGSYASSYRNLVAALEHPGVSERFVLMMDDVFVMWPQELTTLHRGAIASHRHGSEHRALLRRMGRWLEQQGKGSLDYDLHAPFVLDKPMLREVVDMEAPEKLRHAAVRSLYGNWHEIGGWPVEDFKVRPPFEIPHRPFISTNDMSFERKPIGVYVRDQFPEPSIYEGDA